MKKLISLVLIAAMVLTLTACGKTADPPAPSNTGDKNGGIAKEDLKIGFIHISDPSDKGYTYNHDLGTWAMVEKLGLKKEQVINKYNIGEDEGCATAINELIEAGCQIIFATSFGHGDYMKEAAVANPDIQFCHATGDAAVNAGLSNFHNYFTSIYEARYLAGIAAGMKLKELNETKLGYVAAFECAEVVSGLTAFYLGAKSVNPDVTMDVIYTNSWHDPIAEAQVAQTLIDGGCKVISQHSDSTAPATTAEANGVFQVGYNADMIDAAPQASLISARSDWSIYLTFAVESMINGTGIPIDWCQGLSEGAVYLSPLNTDIAAPGTQEAIDKASEGIKKGEIHVFAGPLSGKGYNWGQEGTIEVAEGEYFEESKKQSAPYWYYIIEGVNVLGK
ncbi:MAG: BMP family ABC transporter substrate-binding protein [Acetivibrionales bacterium]|jgi:basic membrane protein A